MQYIELDASNSGCALAGILLRHRDTCVLTNLSASPEKHDLYDEVVKATKGIKSLEAIHQQTNPPARAVFKVPTISRVYGSGLKTTRETLAKHGVTDPQAAIDLFDAVSTVIEPVLAIQAYWKDAVSAIVKAGKVKSISLVMPTGISINVPLRYVQRRVPTFRVTAEAYGMSIDTDVIGCSVNTGSIDIGSASRVLAAAMIQGLDSLVLARTEIKLGTEGSDFFTKHDAILLTADRAEEVNRAYREAMHETFSSDVMRATHDALCEAHDGVTIPYNIKMGNFDVDELLSARPLS